MPTTTAGKMCIKPTFPPGPIGAMIRTEYVQRHLANALGLPSFS